MLDAEQEELRRTVRTLLNRRSDKRRADPDPQLWKLLAEQIGAHSLAIPEEYGGTGFSLLESHVVLEELGAALTPSPFASTTLAAQAILAAGDKDAMRRLLPGIAAGESVATLAWAEESGSWDPALIRATGTRDGRLSGTKHHVLDGDAADIFLVPARVDDGIGLFEVSRADAGTQLQGGIGITWKHDIHLYFKRAHATSQLFGSPAEHRRRYARAVGLAA